MKTLVMPSSINQINNLKCDGVIVGIKKLSINMPFYLELEEIKEIKDKEIFVCLNKNMHNSDIELLTNTLIELNNYNIKAVIFYDIAIPNLYKKLSLKYDLVWNQEHMTNNYYTINFWNNYDVKYTWVSNDITLRELKEIKENTKSNLLITLFGYIPMFTSKRHLVKNYVNTFNLSNQKEINYMEKEGKIYPVVDDELGTSVYTNFILNGLKEKLELDYDYIILNSFLIDDDKFSKVLNIFNSVDKNNLEEKQNELNSLFDNLGSGFFYEETIYKVK